MKRLQVLTLFLAMIATATIALGATTGATDRTAVDRQHVMDGPGTILTSSGSSLLARETAGPDTFAIYGGPDEPEEGKFQVGEDNPLPDWGDGNGLPYVGGAGSWTPVDLTDQAVYWHVDTFNAGNLNSNGAGNHAMWSGLDGTDPVSSSWVNSPGYGNGWNDYLLYESVPIVDTSVGETVTLDFFFNHDTEPGYDYFNVDYDSAGTWTNVYNADASNKDGSNVFLAPGLQYSLQGAGSITYVGNDFGGDALDQICIRLGVTSDGAWSDEDGLWPTHGGAAQVDDITLTTSQGTFTEDYEGAFPFLFNRDKAPFAGDFAEVYARFTDIDPCRDNATPVIGMIDFNQTVRNGPALDGTTFNTGGSLGSTSYGIVGNWVSNYTGGLSLGRAAVANEIWSPDIVWDLPGTADDAVGIAGAKIRFDVWRDLPLRNGYFYLWHVRSATSGTDYDTWTDRNFVYYGSAPSLWLPVNQDVSDILQAGPEHVQVAVAAWDYGDVFDWGGNDATPSPVFDNVAFYKYRVGGPTFATRTIDTAQDGFPNSGAIDVSTQAARDALDVAFSMARDVNTGDLTNTAGDSVIVDVASVIPGATVTDIRMVWALDTNPLFEDAIRSAPARVKDENVVAGAAGTVWTGEVVAGTSATSAGAIIADRFFVDLPDVDLMYPGDVLHYYVQATDSDGRLSTWPNVISGFGTFGPGATYNRLRTVRCLPTITDAAGAQPKVLVYNDFGRRGGEAEWKSAFSQIGYGEGVQYDSYTTQGPSSGVSNGIGSSGQHGATTAQLGGYEHIFYFSGNLDTQLLSNGDGTISGNDKSDDINVMEQWHALAGNRNVVYFGDFIASALARDSPEGLAYLGASMGVDVLGGDVRAFIGGQTAPVIAANAGGSYAGNFATSYVAYGGCIAINKFDQIQPLVGAEAGHYFLETPALGGGPITDPAKGVASVINPATNGLDITFPYGSLYIQNTQARASVGLSARALLFQEIMGLFNAPSGGTATDRPASAARRFELSATPNPFNPMTTVKFAGAVGMSGSVKVYNLRGELLKMLHKGEFTTDTFQWNGKDQRGASVASGVYVIQAEADGNVKTIKAALVK
ncbi:hypothetical protein DRQ53_12100 [bacterium]|nr:MAG: hypothetical protein DRQ53_12100 [bacterium]